MTASVIEKVERALERIRRDDAAYNSFLRTYPETARVEALRSDERRVSGAELGALDGCTVAVKDNLAVAGAPLSAGIAGCRDAVAEEDATAVACLRAAGAVILGSTNMEEAALGTVTDNPVFGRCFNPLMPGYTPGGSSGGSAAAVAAGFADLALGTDTMGSVRLPAAYCGVVGLKPTHGLIGAAGLVPLAPSLDTIGPLARDVNLLWPAVQAMAGVDGGDPESRPVPDGWSRRAKRNDLAGLTFGLPRQVTEIACEAAVIAGLDHACQSIRDLGGRVAETGLPGWEPGRDRRAGLLVIEAEGAAALGDLMEADGALSPRLLSLLRYGRDARSARLVDALRRIRATAAAVGRALAEVDALILPTAPQRAFPHGAAIPANQADFMPLANFSGCPAVALPVPLEGEVLPASVQIIGPRWSEAALSRWAELLEPVLSGPGD